MPEAKRRVVLDTLTVQACLNVAHVTKMPNLRKIRFILKPNLSDSDAALVWKLNDFLHVKHRCEKQQANFKANETPFASYSLSEYVFD